MSQKAYLVGTHRYSFQAGEPGEILGVKFLTPQSAAGTLGVEFQTPRGRESRACYHVRFKDNREDFVPLADSQFFEIISEDDVVAGRIPAVIH